MPVHVGGTGTFGVISTDGVHVPPFSVGVGAVTEKLAPQRVFVKGEHAEVILGNAAEHTLVAVHAPSKLIAALVSQSSTPDRAQLHLQATVGPVGSRCKSIGWP